MNRYLALGLLLTLTLGFAAAQGPDEPEPPAEKGRTHIALDPGGHIGLITGIAFIGKGAQVMTVGRDRTIQEWDVKTGERLKVHRPPVGGLGWGGFRGMGLLPKPHPKGVPAVVVAEGGTNDPAGSTRLVNRLFVVNRGTGAIVELATPGHKPRTSVDVVTSRFAQGGTVASAQKHTVLVHTHLDRLWLGDAKQAAQAREPSWQFDTGGKAVRALALSGDGKRLAAVTLGEGPMLFVWDVEGGKLLQSTGLPYWAHDVTWSPGGKQLATCMSTGWKDPLSDPVVELWSADGKLQRTFTGKDLTKRYAPAGERRPILWAYNVAYRNADELVTTLHWGSKGGGTEQVVVIDLKAGTSREVYYRDNLQLPHAGFEDGRLPIAISPDRNLAAVPTAPRGSRIAWIDLNGKNAPSFSGPGDTLGGPIGWGPDAAAISFNVRNKAKDSGPNRTLDLKGLQLEIGPVATNKLTWNTGERAGYKVSRAGETFKHYLSIQHKDKEVAKTSESFTQIERFTLSAAGPPWLAWSDRTGVRIGDPATGSAYAWLQPWQTRSPGMASSPDGKYLVTSTSRDLIRIYKVEGARDNVYPLLTIYTRGADWVAYTQQGYYAATPGGEKLMGWRVNEGVDRLATYYPLSRFRKQFHRPDVIAKLLEEGSVAAALKAAGRTPVAVEDVLPPAAEIVGVEGDPQKALTVTVKARARSKGQPITSLRLMMDGRPVPGTVVELKGEAEVTRTFKVEVPAGRHGLAVLARSADASGLSNEVETFRRGQRAARLASLFIGINDYEDPSLRLNAAVPDAEALAAAVVKNVGAPLFNRVDKPLLVRNREATKKGILDALAALRKQDLGGNDLAIIGFAGHGTRVGREFYLMPVEAKEGDVEKKGVSGSELRAALKDWPCQVLVLLDACHSGAGGKAILKGAPATDAAAVDLADDETGAIVLCAAMGHQCAYETSGKNPRGFFSQAVEKALAADTGVPHSRDRSVFLHHLHAFVIDEVMTASGEKQHPFLYQPDGVESIPLVSYKGK